MKISYKCCLQNIFVHVDRQNAEISVMQSTISPSWSSIFPNTRRFPTTNAFFACWHLLTLRTRTPEIKQKRFTVCMCATSNRTENNRPYRLFTFHPMASFPCLPVLARQACAWRLHLMFPARICCFLILSPITNLSLNVLCTKHEDWCHTKTRLLGQKWINGKVYLVSLYTYQSVFPKRDQFTFSSVSLSELLAL